MHETIESYNESTVEQKRRERFDAWLSPEGIEFKTPEAEQLYKQRVQRIIDAIELKKPDKVPVYVHLGTLPANYFGYKNKDVMYDYNKLKKAWLLFLEQYNLTPFDTFSASGILPGRVLDILDLKTYKWAGHGVPDNSSLQYIEGGYMLAEEYPYFIEDPSSYTMKILLPRVLGSLEPLKSLPAFVEIGNSFVMNLAPYGSDEVLAAFRSLVEAGKEVRKFGKVVDHINNRIMSAGYPPFFAALPGTPIQAPFDGIANSRRGTVGLMLDIYRSKDIILEMLEKLTQMTISQISRLTFVGGSPIVFMGLHRGADGFMSEQQFTTFYWPYLKRVVLALIQNGFVPCLFAEGGYNSRLEIVKDLPAGKVIWHFDSTDIAKAKKFLEGNACIMGNVPVSKLVACSPGEVKDYCKKLIEIAGQDGGFVLAPGAMSHEYKLENVAAMVESAKESGDGDVIA